MTTKFPKRDVKTDRLTRAEKIVCPKCPSKRVWNKSEFYECMKCKHRWYKSS